MTATSSNPARECQPGTASLVWQAIDSAPKDGSRTLIAWVTMDDKWFFSFATWIEDIEHFCLEGSDACVGARYWMPLPPPPESI